MRRRCETPAALQRPARARYARSRSISRLFHLGWIDNMAINICQRQPSGARVILGGIDHDHKTLDHSPAHLGWRDSVAPWRQEPHVRVSK
jgi:hypothetical protein